MKIFCLLFFIALGVNKIYAQSYSELSRSAYNLFASKEYDKSFDIYVRAFKLNRNKKNDLYFAACAATMANKVDSAFAFLNSSVNVGWNDLKSLKETEELNKLHNDNRWDLFLSNSQKKIDLVESRYNQPVKKELEHIYGLDQKIRLAYLKLLEKYNNDTSNVGLDSLKSELVKTDSLNLQKVSRILDNYGWLGLDEIGEKGSLGLTLVIQHADLKTQKKYLPMMKEAQKSGKVNIGFVTSLEDRIAVTEGKKQIYGSQLELNATTKKYYVLPVIEPENLEKRRAAAGLPPMNDYLKQWGLEWSLDSYYKGIIKK